MATDSYGVISDMAQVFRPYVENIYQDLKLGLCKTKVDIERITGTVEGAENQFRLVLPYCSKKIKWEVIFDTSTPWFAPDFRFDDESFLSNLEEDFLENKVPSLSNWNENDPKALSSVISELLNLYKIHQIRKLNEDESSRAYFEYSALLGDQLTSERDIEVWVGSHVVEFLIRLNVDASQLPELFNESIEQNPGIDTALLLVRYPNSTNAELILSPLLTKSLGNISLPPMHQSGVLMDYVPMVTTLLNNKELQQILNDLAHSSQRIGFRMNLVKTKVMFNEHVDPGPVSVDGISLEVISEYAYLGQINFKREIKRRIRMGWAAFGKLRQGKIQALLNNEKLKRELLAQLIVKYEGAVLEHDANNAAFLFEMNDFHWILQIDIGTKFPDKPPILTLRSVYHSSKGKPKHKVLPSCPYNNFEGYIEQQVEIFKNECKGVSSQIINIDN